jgi:hypothetical protein
MAKKQKENPKNKLTDKAQSERFKQTARELGIEENDQFELIAKRIATSRLSHPSPAPKVSPGNRSKA